MKPKPLVCAFAGVHQTVQGLKPDDRNRFDALPELGQLLSLPSSLSRRKATGLDGERCMASPDLSFGYHCLPNTTNGRRFRGRQGRSSFRQSLLWRRSCSFLERVNSLTPLREWPGPSDNATHWAFVSTFSPESMLCPFFHEDRHIEKRWVSANMSALHQQKSRSNFSGQPACDSIWHNAETGDTMDAKG